jgi:indolepyruvate decarboxylase
MQQTRPQPLGEYLIRRLHALGLRHAFGVPGDYILGMFGIIEQSPLELVVATSELCAGYAADGYARVHGLAAVLCTYGVGGLSLANPIGCAYAERSPVVLISGAPGLRERNRSRKRGEQLHHTVCGYETQREVFAHLTCARAVLDDRWTAFAEIERVLAACLYHQRPVYLEIPRDRIDLLPGHATIPVPEKPPSDPHALAEAVAEAVERLRASRTPILVAGIEVVRYRLQQQVLALAEACRLPMTALFLSKGAVPERHPLYAGLYQTAYGPPEETQFIEESDCLLMLGTLLTDVDTGVYTHTLDKERVIEAAADQVRMRHHYYPQVRLEDFVRGLAAAQLGPLDRTLPAKDSAPPVWRPRPGAAMTVQRLIQKIDSCLDGQTILVADPGETLLAAGDMRLPPHAEFHAPAFYLTLGWAVPAAVGAAVARPMARTIVLVGDGAFQNTGGELSNAARRSLSPVIIVLNNQGYVSERFLAQGKFNEIPDWNFHKLPDYLGAGRGFDVHTEDELEAALTAALAERSTFSLLNVHVDRNDRTPALRRMAALTARRR